MTEVRFEVVDRVGHLLLDGVGTLNSITPDVLTGLEQVLDLLEGTGAPDVRVLVLRGAASVFSVGMDIGFLAECFADPQGVFVPFTHRFHAVLERLEALPVPVVAVVDGLARAGGFELLLTADLVLATDSAKVADTHAEFGIVPGAGATARAVRRLGGQRAREVLLGGRWYRGSELVEAGIAVRCVPDERLEEALEELLAGMRNRSPAAVGAIKGLLDAVADVPLAQGLALERDAFARFHAEVPDSDEGFRAYVEGRQPAWGPA